jgi:hypothetical protein
MFYPVFVFKIFPARGVKSPTTMLGIVSRIFDLCPEFWTEFGIPDTAMLGFVSGILDFCPGFWTLPTFPACNLAGDGRKAWLST